MLVETRREPPPPPPADRPAWEPNWRMCGWIAAAVACGVAAQASVGAAAFLLVCACLACACRALTVALPYGDGLREHRQ